MKKLILLILPILLLSTVIKSQEPDFKKRISIEAGLGYNTLSWETTSSNENLESSRNQFAVFPSFKIKYSIPLYKIKNNSVFEVAPFAGYNTFGGKSGKETNGYEDIIHLQSFEVGILPTYSINDKFKFYGGLKGQYIFNAKQKSYGSILDPAGTGRTWKTSDVNGLFKDFSLSVGVGFSYTLKRFSAGIETWYGITNLSSHASGAGKLKIYENNYRLMIGYRIK